MGTRQIRLLEDLVKLVRDATFNLGFCIEYCVHPAYVSSGGSCGWVCAGDNALGSGAVMVQGEWPQQDAIQYQQLSQWEHIAEKVLQGALICNSQL